MDLRQRAFHWPLAERRASPTLPLSHEDPRSLRWRRCWTEQAALGEAGSTEGGVQATRPITHLPQQLSIPGAAVTGGRDTPTNSAVQSVMPLRSPGQLWAASFSSIPVPASERCAPMSQCSSCLRRLQSWRRHPAGYSQSSTGQGPVLCFSVISFLLLAFF